MMEKAIKIETVADDGGDAELKESDILNSVTEENVSLENQSIEIALDQLDQL